MRYMLLIYTREEVLAQRSEEEMQQVMNLEGSAETWCGS